MKGIFSKSMLVALLSVGVVSQSVSMGAPFDMEELTETPVRSAVAAARRLAPSRFARARNWTTGFFANRWNNAKSVASSAKNVAVSGKNKVVSGGSWIKNKGSNAITVVNDKVVTPVVTKATPAVSYVATKVSPVVKPVASFVGNNKAVLGAIAVGAAGTKLYENGTLQAGLQKANQFRAKAVAKANSALKSAKAFSCKYKNPIMGLGAVGLLGLSLKGRDVSNAVASLAKTATPAVKGYVANTAKSAWANKGTIAKNAGKIAGGIAVGTGAVNGYNWLKSWYGFYKNGIRA